jgi:hypothetical protein
MPRSCGSPFITACAKCFACSNVMDELDFLARAIECAEDSIDAITGVAEYDPDAPLVKPLDQEIADCLRRGRRLSGLG